MKGDRNESNQMRRDELRPDSFKGCASENSFTEFSPAELEKSPKLCQGHGRRICL